MAELSVLSSPDDVPAATPQTKEATMFVANSVVRSTGRNFRSPSSKISKSHPKRHSSVFLSTVPDSFVGGVLIVAESGEAIYANSKARTLCRQLSSPSSSPAAIPDIIWQLCQSSLDSHELFPDCHLILESDVEIDGTLIRLRVRYFERDRRHGLCLLVNLDEV